MAVNNQIYIIDISLKNMKNKVVFFVLLLFFTFPLASAISTTMQESYSQKETMIIEIKGNLLSGISSDDIEFKRNNVLVPLNYGLEQIQGRYFLWAIAPDKNETYTLVIKDVDTTVNGKQESITYMQNFSILTNLSEYNVKPGVIIANENFEVEIESYVDDSISVNVNFPYEQSIVLKPGKNEFTFSIDSIRYNTFTALRIGEYTIPLYIKTGREDSSINKRGLYFEPSFIKRNVGLNQELIYTIFVKNAENVSFEDVFFEYDKDLFVILPDGKFNLKDFESKQFNLTLKNDFTENFESSVVIVYGSGERREIPIEISLDTNINTINENFSAVPVSEYFCSELAGVKCSVGESCSGENKEAIDGVCCLGTCTTSNSSSGSSNAWIGYLLALIIFGIIGYVVYKYKKTKKEVGGDIEEKLGVSRLSKMKETGEIGRGLKVDKEDIDSGKERKGLP